ncbi:M23 family metallopeptidase [Deinococcus hopiensis]|uniref:Membrane proteins related to metalloendopeptidases n=1 Tax=Deinococcus hopiensis KR-140 TaxID=695939 RepID=A0A1W1VS13_9DEIO|nr:M23 family metallopeptidase [Deinococcus hopiensis]SMB96182.1 Membrane proteins related to metalloendopeptidases [Deinococcus hopiensis KR-140]
MSRPLRRLLVFALLAGLLALLWPGLRLAWQGAQLVGAPAPTTLPNPLPGRRFADTWAAARSGGRRHEGVDIFAPRGTPIRATTRGFVVYVGHNPLGGRTVMVLGPGQQRHYYAHLDRYPNLRMGRWIGAGTVVGYVGDSGNAKGTPTHLHYGIYTPSGAINPYPLLQNP